MSIVAPERPTLVLPDIDLTLIAEIEEAEACQYDTCFRVPHEPCPNQAAWLAVFKKKCEHGGPLEFGDPLLCQQHKELFATGSGLHCGGCMCPLWRVGGWHHIIESFKEIK